ncbi:MAG: type II 3-dehydroquinate dehydratase [Clostridia bacterium]|nr:type II 3-dehydroquinate dehydratase [Clostridia bacterium]
MKILVINGPNLNLLGKREPHIYGTKTLDDINKELKEFGEGKGIRLEFFQSNHEGEIIDKIQQADCNYSGIIINPGAYTHYSYAIRDAVASIGVPVVEVHLSNIFSREDFRHHSVISPVVKGQICGFGALGYKLAVFALIDILDGNDLGNEL